MLRLLGMQLRRDRIVLPIWLVATALLALAGAKGVQGEFGSEAERASVLKLALATPSLLAIRGVPDGPSLGSYVYFQVFCYVAIMAALMSTFLVTRHSRADEERGRRELVASAPVRRTSPLAATLLLGLLANAVLGLLVAGGFAAGGLEVRGSFAAGLAAAAVGLAFTGVAAVVAQVAPTSRSSNGISAGLVGLAFLLRAAGDATGTIDLDRITAVSAWPSWLSPIGWSQQVFAFTRADLAPLWLSVALAVVTAGVALAVQARRDVGSSILRERTGPAVGSLHSHLGLAWRLQWPSALGWAIGGAALGALAGTLAGRIADAGDVADALHDILAGFVPGGKGALIDLLVVAVIGIGGALAAAAGVQAIMRARDEEADGRAELVLAAPLGRVRWLAAWVGVAFAAAVLVALATGLVAGVAFQSNGVDADRLWSSLAAGAAQLPAALAYIALAALVFALLPRLTVPLGWVLLALGLAFGQFGSLLQLPDWVRDLSPFTWTPAIPAADPNWAGAIIMTAVALAGLGLVGVIQRGRQLTA